MKIEEFIKQEHHTRGMMQIKDLETQNLLKNAFLQGICNEMDNCYTESGEFNPKGAQQLLRKMSDVIDGLIQTPFELSNINYSVNSFSEMVDELI